MPEISAAAVRQLRDKTGLPMMDCKKALTEANGDEAGAIDWLRKNGQAIMTKRSDRETAFGRFGLSFGLKDAAGAIVELKCESAPVAQSDEFIQLANGMAKALATGGDAATVDELLDRPSPVKPGMTLREQKDDMFNRIREVFNVGRFKRIAGGTAAYSHNAGTVSGVILSAEGADTDAAKDVCMHIAAMRPVALTKEEVDPTLVEKEREILRDAALKEGKPANIVDKMVEGRLRNFYAERVLTEQPFVKESSISVGQYASSKNLKLKSYIHWELGKE